MHHHNNRLFKTFVSTLLSFSIVAAGNAVYAEEPAGSSPTPTADTDSASGETGNSLSNVTVPAADAQVSSAGNETQESADAADNAADDQKLSASAETDTAGSTETANPTPSSSADSADGQADSETDGLHPLSPLAPHDIEIESVNDTNSANSFISLRKAVNIPTSYDARTVHELTSVKDQANLGICWSYTAIAATEASLIFRGKADTSVNLDEQNLAYYTYHAMPDPLGLLGNDHTESSNSLDYLEYGGNNWKSMMTLANWAGYVPQMFEITRAMSASDVDPLITAALSAGTGLIPGSDTYHLEDAYVINMSDVSTVKEMLMKYGAADIAMYMDGSFYNSATHSYYYNGLASTGSNHEVTLVGWDDAYSKSNFQEGYQPANDGAWLIRNSWGSGWGDGGYFWISYDDTVVSNTTAPNYSQATFFIAEPADNYDHCYQYDGVNQTAWYPIKNSVSEANAFTAQKNESLQAVSFYTYANTNVNYTVEIYRIDKDATDPTSGTKVSEQSGIQVYSGYHTVKLDTPVQLPKGQRYSVVIKLSKENEKINVLFDTSESIGDLTDISTSAAGQSFFNMGYGWYDFADPSSSSGNGNLKIKAFTKEDKYSASYAFQSSTSGKELPAAVVSLLPQDTTYYASDDIVTAAQPAKISVLDGNGVWQFNGYDASEKTVSDANIIFTGTWSYLSFDQAKAKVILSTPRTTAAKIRLYSATEDKFAIRSDIQSDCTLCLAYVPVDGTADVTSGQTVYFMDVPAGTYQVASYQPDCSVAITDITISTSMQTAALTSYKLGDTNHDGKLRADDVMETRIMIASQNREFAVITVADVDNDDKKNLLKAEDVLALRIAIASGK